jgi:hypothetical protein
MCGSDNLGMCRLTDEFPVRKIALQFEKQQRGLQQAFDVHRLTAPCCVKDVDLRSGTTIRTKPPLAQGQMTVFWVCSIFFTKIP